MLHPSYTDLMEVINSEVEEGEAPVVQSRYSVVIATAKRARQLISGAEPLVDGRGKKPLSIAIEEVYKGEVKIISVDESDEDDDKIMEYASEVFDVALEDDEVIFADEVDVMINEENNDYYEDEEEE